MQWAIVQAELDKAFELVRDQVKKIYPEVRAGRYWRPDTPGDGGEFDWQAFFIHEGQDWEDVLLNFACGRLARVFVGSERVQEPERDPVRFDIERGGTGEDIASLEPVLLPERSAAEYDEAVMEYVRRTVEFLHSHTGTIIESLKEPFDYSDKDRPPPPSPESARWLTDQLRHSPDPYWMHLRRLLADQGLGPSELIVGHVFRPRELSQLRGEGVTSKELGLGDVFPGKVLVLIESARKVAILGLDWEPLGHDDDWIETICASHWREANTSSLEEFYRMAVDAGLAILEDGGR